jgi:hypothetical protein
MGQPIEYTKGRVGKKGAEPAAGMDISVTAAGATLSLHPASDEE